MSRKKINQNNSDIYGELVDFQDIYNLDRKSTRLNSSHRT